MYGGFGRNPLRLIYMPIQSFPSVQQWNYAGLDSAFLVGRSMDSKPLTVPSGSLFLETDTENFKHFNGGDWVSPTKVVLVVGCGIF